MAKILIIEDDMDINNLLARIMSRQGHEAVQAFSGTEGKLRLELERYDLMLLDLMLPGMMGEELIREIRQTDKDLPIIVLSAKSALEDRVSVLEMGADDYLVKPFAVEEVAARVSGALRRSARHRELMEQVQHSGEEVQGECQSSPQAGDELHRECQSSPQAGDELHRECQSSSQAENKPYREHQLSRQKDSEKQKGSRQLQFKDMTLDADRREVRVRGQLLNLTAHEYDILHILMQEPGKVYSRERLYELVWQGGYYGEDNTVNVHVSNLRKKIAAVDSTEYIATVWGIGFRMS